VDDNALVRAAQRGDRDAFGALVSKHAASIVRVATRMTGSDADGEDAAQEAFIAAYKALPSFKFESRFSTWLYRIAVNKCKDAIKMRRPDTALGDSQDADGPSWEPSDEDTPEWALSQIELASELDHGIQALPHLYRESFVLRHVEGLDYEEMSAILGVHRDTLKMRVYKARTLLCQSLAHLAGAYR
jgi:RNA polymerase sigma-70 factor (ECF subfamily)